MCDENQDNPLAINRNYWAGELKGHLINISDIKIKSDHKYKVTKEKVIGSFELNYEDSVVSMIHVKFNKEYLNKYVNIMSYKCSSEEEINEYVKEPLG